MTTNNLTNAIIAGISDRRIGTAWRNNRIDAMAAGRGGKLRRVSAGIDGQADITGIMLDGRRLEIEVKNGRDQQSDKQVAFQRMIESHGGVYVVARDVERCLDWLQERMRIRL
jgi:hypothetical protein